MRKILLTVAMSSLLFACSSEEDVASTSPGSDELRVSFNVKSPASGVVTYADPLALAVETEVNVLYVYVFGPDPAVAVPAGTTEDYVLEGIHTFENPSSIGNAGGQTLSGISVRGKNKKHFYFIANRQFSSMTMGTTKETSVINATPGVLSMPNYPYISMTDNSLGLIAGMPMNSYAEVDFTSGTPQVVAPATDFNVVLERPLARIDIENNVGKDDPAKSFVIENVQFYSRNSTYFYATDALSGGTTVLGKTLPNGPSPIPVSVRAIDGYYGAMFLTGAVPVTNAVTMPAVGYLHECPADGGAYVRIRGIYSEDGKITTDPVIIDVPFLSTAVVRNHIYKLVTTSTGQLKATFTVSDWIKTDAVEVINDTPYVIDFKSVTVDAGNTTPVIPPALAASLSGNTLTLPVEGGTFTVSVDGKGLALLMQAVNCPWISSASIVLNTVTGFYDLTMTTTSNDAAAIGFDRGYTLYIKGNVPSSPAKTLRVTQRAKTA